MPLDIQGILQNVSLTNEQVTVLEPYLREVFCNEAPLYSRLPVEPVGNNVFEIITYDLRPAAYTLAGAFTASTGSTTLTLADATALQVGDVLEVLDTAGAATERVEVTAASTDGVTVTVRRARESTTVIANTAGGSAGSLVVSLIGNSRTGAEVNQQGRRAVRTLVEQYVQTFQYAVEVGGLANAVTATRLPAGISDVFSMNQKVAMTEMVREIERTLYYGIGEKPTAAGDRAKMKGFRTLIKNFNGGANYTASAGASFTKLNFAAAIQKAFDGGGNPDVCVCASNLLTGLSTWSVGLQQFPDPRTNALGLPIREFQAPFLGQPITFIPSLTMKAGSFLVGTSSDLKMRRIREAFWTPRGIIGDAKQGDYIGDYTAELGHPGWHQFTEGITSFA
jgi:TusA-related sulfurtransferase